MARESKISQTKDLESYLKDHKVMELLEHLASEVVYHTPKNPTAFLANVLRDMMTARAEDQPVDSMFVSEESLRACFRLMDPLGTGNISWKQATSILEIIGLRDVPVPILIQGPVDEELFVRMAKDALSKRLPPS